MRRRPDQLHLQLQPRHVPVTEPPPEFSHMRGCRHRREEDRKLRALRTISALVATLGLAGGGTPAEGSASRAALGCPAMAQPGQQFTAEVRIDIAAPTALGAYSLTLSYDP